MAKAEQVDCIPFLPDTTIIVDQAVIISVVLGALECERQMWETKIAYARAGVDGVEIDVSDHCRVNWRLN